MFSSESTRANADRIQPDRCIEVHLHTKVGELIGERGVLEGVGVEDIEADRGSRCLRPRLWCSSGPTRAQHGSPGRSPSTRAATCGPAPTPFPDRERAEGPVSPPGLLETNVPGVFAAGDVGSGSVKRVASAVGEGAMAIRLVREHLAQVR